MASHYSPELWCRWEKWEVVSDTVLRLHLPAGNVCDMAGCIRTAAAIMPEVETVETYQGGRPDTYYVMQTDRNWYAVHDGKEYPACNPLQKAAVIPLFSEPS